MQTTKIEAWLQEAQAGEITWSDLAERLLGADQLPAGEHRPDADRRRRCGFGEVIFGSGKSADDVIRIARTLLDAAARQLDAGALQSREVLATRLEPDIADQVQAAFLQTRYDRLGRTLRISDHPIAEVNAPPYPAPFCMGRVAVVTAGSTDYPVACEAIETLRWMGVAAELLTDVGVAGPYRLLPHLGALRQAVAVVVIAGMEGALASVLGGLVPCPVVAVPTSVGYGSNFEGITTLLSMMSSCAAGVTVVNIDAGFKGAYVAGLIAARQPSAT